VGLGLVALWVGAVQASATARALEAKIAERLGPLSREEALGLALLSAFAEELFFRGALQGALGLGLLLIFRQKTTKTSILRCISKEKLYIAR